MPCAREQLLAPSAGAAFDAARFPPEVDEQPAKARPVQVVRAQNPATLDAHTARDQVHARPARLALGPHLRGEEKAELLHGRLGSVVCRLVRVPGSRRGNVWRTLRPLGTSDPTHLGEEGGRSGSVR